MEEIDVERKHLTDYLSVLVRRRWAMLLVILTFALTSLLATFLATPMYRARMTLQIERQNPDVLNFRDLGRMDYAWAAYTDFYQTQYKIIASDAVAQRAADQLGLASHPEFMGQSKKPSLLARIKGLIPRKGTHIALSPRDQAAAKILGGLEVLPVRNSHLVHISWVSSDPQLAADVANAVGRAYIHYNMSSRLVSTGEAGEFLMDQIHALTSEIAAIEGRLQEYGESKRIVSIDESNNITMQALQDIAQKRTSAQTELAEADSVYRAVFDAPPEALPEVMNSALINRLREEYASYENEFTEKSQQFKNDWPGMQILKSKLEQARSRLEIETGHIVDQVRASAEAARNRSKKNVEGLNRLLAQKEADAQLLRRDAVKYTTLHSEVAKKRETLDALVKRQSEMALSGRLQEIDSNSATNIRTMQTARVPPAPYSPKTKLNLLMGLFLGLTGGIGLAFLLEYIDNTIKTPGELEKMTPLPILCVVPRHNAVKPTLTRVGRRRISAEAPSIPLDLISAQDSRSTASEAYRELRTSILLSNPGKPPRRIMITSAVPEEGKTSTSINLAIVLSQLGRRVLLVDTDLRRPRVHIAFGAENKRGVSTCLSGLEPDASQLVIPTSVERLDLLPSGPIPPNPSELLNSVAFEEMGRELLAHGYDHIIFDSPPALSVSDALIISTMVDAGVLVVRAGRTPRQSVKLAAGKFLKGGTAPFGIVLNDLDTEEPGSAYGRYHYYGRYGESDATHQDHDSADSASA